MFTRYHRYEMTKELTAPWTAWTAPSHKMAMHAMFFVTAVAAVVVPWMFMWH